MNKEIKLRMMTSSVLSVSCGEKWLHITVQNKGDKFLLMEGLSRKVVRDFSTNSTNDVETAITEFISRNLNLSEFWTAQSVMNFADFQKL